LKNFPQFVVIHAVKDFGIVNKAKVDVFLELSCFFDDLADIGSLIYCIYVYTYIYVKFQRLYETKKKKSTKFHLDPEKKKIKSSSVNTDSVLYSGSMVDLFSLFSILEEKTLSYHR